MKYIVVGERIRGILPKGYFKAELRTWDGDSGGAQAEPRVCVDFEGTLIADGPIDFGPDGFIPDVWKWLAEKGAEELSQSEARFVLGAAALHQ